MEKAEEKIQKTLGLESLLMNVGCYEQVIEAMQEYADQYYSDRMKELNDPERKCINCQLCRKNPMAENIYMQYLCLNNPNKHKFISDPKHYVCDDFLTQPKQ